jgi:uncharacterized cupin superfamily protein
MITRRDLIVAAVAIAITTAVVAFAQAAGKPILHSSAFNWRDLKADDTKAGQYRKVFDSRTATMDDLEVHITTLNPGESPHPAHRHPEEEMMLIKEGTLEAVFNGTQTNRVAAGGVIFAASNELHSIRNIGTNRATYFVVKFRPNNLDIIAPDGKSRDF